MDQSATAALDFAPPAPLPLVVDFRGGRLTSDGGWSWVAEADQPLVSRPHWPRSCRITAVAAVATHCWTCCASASPRSSPATKTRTTPTRCARPAAEAGLWPLAGVRPRPGQPAHLLAPGEQLSARDCYRLAVALGEVYLRERERDGIPRRIVLDLDSTDDPTHGEQEGSAYHGYFRQHMYHPLLVFDGETGHFITAILRPGTAHAGAGALAILRRLVRRLRARWPGVTIELRADAGFAKPEIYAYCERERITYTIGLGSNARLESLAAPLVATALAAQAAADGAKVRLLDETLYQAASWPTPRRIVIKAEALAKGTNTRFVVTTRSDPRSLYAWYTARGETENWIKDLKAACFADRLSCHRFLANQVRLLLHGAAYWLLDTLRRWLVRAGAERMRWRRCACACSRSGAASANSPPASICASPPAIPASPSGTASRPGRAVHE